MNDDIRIEFPAQGATYCRQQYGVYQYDEYPRHSVNYGMVRRTFLDSFNTLEEAQAKYPKATVAEGSGYCRYF